MKKFLSLVLLFIGLSIGTTFGGGIFQPGTGGGSGDLTEVQVTGPLTVSSGTGPIPIVGIDQPINAQIGTTYTYVDGDKGKLVTHSNAAAIAATLPNAAGAGFDAGWFMDVQNRGTGILTITPTTSKIDGQAFLKVNTFEGVRVVSDGTNYFTQRGPHNAPINPRHYGAFADGSSHTITAGDITAHTEWLGTYSAGDEWDYVALQEAYYAAFGGPGAEHSSANSSLNRELNIPCGTYLVNKKLIWKHTYGGIIHGGGRACTIIKATGVNLSAVETNGFSYNRIVGMQFVAGAANTGSTFELSWDGSTTGWSQGLQANTFQDVSFDGSGLAAAIGLRCGGGGFMCSENSFINTHWFWYTTACYVSSNNNALANTFVGGNMQNCSGDGIRATAGNVAVYGMGFQNGSFTAGALTQSGYDINLLNSAQDGSIIDGIRTESAKVLQTASFHAVSARGIRQNIAVTVWTPTTAYAANSVVTGTTPTPSDGRVYTCGVCGTSGATEPAWPGIVDGSTTVADGAMTWTLINWTAVQLEGGTLQDSNIIYGQVLAEDSAGVSSAIRNNTFGRPDWLVYSGSYANATSSTNICGNTVHLGAGPNSSNTATFYSLRGAEAAGSNFVTSVAPCDFGGGIVQFTLGGGGLIAPTVGIKRGDWVTGESAGSATDISRNVLGIYGTLGRPVASGTNQTGVDLYIQPGLGTGTGTSGTGHLRAAAAGGSGSQVNNSTDILTWGPTGVTIAAGLTFTAPTINATTALQVGGAALNFSHLAGTATDAQIPDTITVSNYLPLAGGTLTGQLVTDNLGIEFEESDTNPTCAAGNYTIYADLSETKFKKCTNGVVSDLDTTGGTPSFDAITAGTNTTAAMVVGTGASLGVSGSGTITANRTTCTGDDYLKADGTCAAATGSGLTHPQVMSRVSIGF